LREKKLREKKIEKKNWGKKNLREKKLSEKKLREKNLRKKNFKMAGKFQNGRKYFHSFPFSSLIQKIYAYMGFERKLIDLQSF